MGGTHNLQDIGWETQTEEPLAEPRHT